MPAGHDRHLPEHPGAHRQRAGGGSARADLAAAVGEGLGGGAECRRRPADRGVAMTPSVAIVGGGLAGITAALDCVRAGSMVTLLEARGRLRGAPYSFTRDGLRADNGQHVFLRCCTAYRDLLEELAATDLVALQPRLRIPVLGPDGRRGWLYRSGLPGPLHLSGALVR